MPVPKVTIFLILSFVSLNFLIFFKYFELENVLIFVTLIKKNTVWNIIMLKIISILYKYHTIECRECGNFHIQ